MSLTIASAAFLVGYTLQTDPVGGWHAPLWRAPDMWLSNSWNEPTPLTALEDVTGDGVRDLLWRSLQDWSFTVFDGASGRIWLGTDANQQGTATSGVIVEDVDGDGFLDFLYAQPELSEDASIPGAGLLRMIRGGSAHPHLLWSESGREPRQSFGHRLRLADLTGNGRPEVIALSRSSSGTELTVLDGLTGSLLWESTPGEAHHFEVTPDISGTGGADLLVWSDNAIRLLEGSTGFTLWTHTAVLPDWTFERARFSDVSGDGLPDIFLAESLWSRSYLEGRIIALDGARGSALWKREGKEEGDRLGSAFELEDLNGDGFVDVVDLHDVYGPDRSLAIAFDGRTGARLWEHRWVAWQSGVRGSARVDLNGDGVRDVVRLVPDGTGRSTRLLASSGVDGSLLWPTELRFLRERLRRIVVVELDGDGVDDLIVTGPGDHPVSGAGGVHAVSGRDGSLIWERFGSEPDERFGTGVVLAERPGGQVPLAVVRSKGGLPGLHGLEGATGRRLWFSAVPTAADQRGPMATHDLNGDGWEEIVESSNPKTAHTDWVCYDARDGAPVWIAPALGTSPSYLDLVTVPFADLDQDGWTDFATLLYAPVWDRLEVLSGRRGTYRPGLDVEPPALSAAAGGTARFELDLPPEHAGWIYRLLVSEAGPGVSLVHGVEVPLAAGRWLVRTAVGDYPRGMFDAPEGVVDPTGGSIHATLLPGALPPGLVGRTIGFALITGPGTGGFSFSSGVATIDVLP